MTSDLSYMSIMGHEYRRTDCGVLESVEEWRDTISHVCSQTSHYITLGFIGDDNDAFPKYIVDDRGLPNIPEGLIVTSGRGLSVNGLDKDKLSTMARYHTSKMEKIYLRELEHVSDKCIVSDDKAYMMNPPKRFNRTAVVFKSKSTSTVSEQISDRHRKICILGFASHVMPGGKFLEGSHTQEESLCFNSYLYNILKRIQNKEKNIKGYNKFYTMPDWENDVKGYIYVPECRFIHHGESYFRDVLMMAAEDCRLEGHSGSMMGELIKNVFNVAAYNNVDTLVVGAWGCGVFKNDLERTMELWRNTLEEYDGVFKTVYFAIPQHGKCTYCRKIVTGK